MKRVLILGVIALLSLSLSPAAWCSDKKDSDPKKPAVIETEQADQEDSPSILYQVLMYLPNRVLDFVDIVRLRARVGPGVAVGVRATKIAQAYAGSYASVYVGLPGPRQRQTPRSPIGLESYNGAAVSVADATVSGGIGPDYSPTEFGVSIHPLIFGLDFGIDPVEIADLVTGFFFIDLRDDDL